MSDAPRHETPETKLFIKRSNRHPDRGRWGGLGLFLSTAVGLVSAACSARGPVSPATACTATGLPPALATRAAEGTLRAPFMTAAPPRRLFVAPDGDDKAEGTERQPKKTLQAAVDAADAGTEIRIRAGTYRENVRFTRSGPLWLVSAEGPGAARVVPATNDSTFQGYAVHDLALVGLDITAPAPANGDANAIKFAASGDVSVAANRNANLAVIGCTVRVPTRGGYNGVKVSQTDGVFVLGNTFVGAGLESKGDAVDLVAVTNSEVGWNEVTGVPTHAAFQIKGGSTTVWVHDNVIRSCGGDGLWIGGGTLEEVMWPSSAYEACNVTATDNVMGELGNAAVRFVGGQGSHVRHLFSYRTGSRHLQAEVSDVHSPAIQSQGNSVLSSVFDPSRDALYVSAANREAPVLDPANDLPLTIVSNTSGHQSFRGGALITAGGGHDTYVLRADAGTTVIEGFQPGSDVLQGLGDLLPRAQQVGGSVLIAQPDGWRLVLPGTRLGQLSSANFAP